MRKLWIIAALIVVVLVSGVRTPRSSAGRDEQYRPGQQPAQFEPCEMIRTCPFHTEFQRVAVSLCPKVFRVPEYILGEDSDLANGEFRNGNRR
jgi:hypothetical protein